MDLSPAYRVMDELNRRVMEKKTAEQFLSRLWGACVRLFNSGNEGNFIASFVRAIDVQLTDAWNKGAESVGITQEDMTAEDFQVLSSIIDNESSFIEGLATDILQAKQEGITRQEFETQFSSRVDIWANRYNETENRAKMHFGGKTRLEWVLGATEKHCTTCAALNGIVAFAQEWEESQVQPQAPPNHALECGGWKCDCSLVPTDKRRSANALSRIMDIATAGNL